MVGRARQAGPDGRLGGPGGHRRSTKIREALEEAGDEFGLKAGRREIAAQLVDYFMEEAKVVYVIYARLDGRASSAGSGTRAWRRTSCDAEIDRLGD